MSALAIGARPIFAAPKKSVDITVRIGTNKQLFVDDHLITTTENVRRRLGQAQKAHDARPVIVEDRPWEKFAAPILGSVLRDGDRFRLWYRGGGSGPGGGVWCYAESTDGLNWKKPQLGLVPFGENKANNIYVTGQPQAITPFIDPREKDPAKRYKAAINTLRIDTGLAYSRDGLSWKLYREGAAITGRASDTISQVIWDPHAKVYRLYTRTDYGNSKTGEVRGTRDMVAAADADLSDPRSWRKVREWCLGWERGDRQYHRKRQIYSLNGWVYQGVQFALIWALDEPGGSERMDAYLATTRGERPWNLEWIYGDRPLIARGKEGSWDCRWIQPATNIVTWRDKHWLYYVGSSRSHAGKYSPGVKGPKAGIGLATLRLDGFVALAAQEKQGTVTTKPLRIEGKSLAINVEAPQGEITLEVLDEQGRPIPGFTATDAISGRRIDDLRWRPRWKRHADLAAIRGKVVRLRFRMRRAKLYSLQVVK